MTNPDQTPAEDIGVVVDPGRVPGNTDANGLARLTINTEETSQSLTIMVLPQSMHMCENTTLHGAKNGNSTVIFFYGGRLSHDFLSRKIPFIRVCVYIYMLFFKIQNFVH